MYVIAKEEGVGRYGLYKGIQAGLLKQFMYQLSSLGMYEPIKKALKSIGGKSDSVIKKYSAGAISGLIGAVIATPADLIKTRMQALPPGTY